MVVKDTETIKWKPVVGYEAFYLVNNIGQVYSIRSKKKLTPRIHSRGYLRVLLSRSGEQKDAYIHRLVAQAFLGAPPQGKNCINHINENKKDNRVENLEWITRGDNITYSFNLHKEQRRKQLAESSPARVAIVGYDKKTGEFVGQWVSMTEAAKELGVGVSAISHSVRSNGTRSSKGIYFYRKDKKTLDGKN